MFNRYPIVAIIGDRGSGKTVTMTATGKIYAQENNLKIFANYTLIGTDYEYITFNDIVDFPEYLHDAVILIDEAHIGTDAYEFFTHRVKDITKFVTQTRKRKLIFIYTTQVFTQVARRLRDLTDNIIYCETTTIKDVFKLTITDRSLDNNGFIRTLYLHGEPFFKYYDTDEIIELK